MWNGLRRNGTGEQVMTGLRRTLFLVLLAAVGAAASPSAKAQEILPLDQVKPHMRGVARTIFAGQEIEEFDLEVLGVLHNLMGPGQHIILARLLGDKVDYTGVVAGMSGSPVYIDGKLVGALSLRIGAFTKEPIAGITPFESMERAAQQETPAAAAEAGLPRYRMPEQSLAAASLRGPADPYLVPIETPLTFVGFHPQAINRFSEELSQYGFLAVQGGGTAAPENTSPLEPGGAVSAALVTGDMSVAGTCTITHRDADRLYACGHPILQLGQVRLPMTSAEIVATVPSDFNSFKIANIGEAVGAFEQDRSSAVVGRVGPVPPMIPVDLTLRHRDQEDRYHFKIFQHPKMSPLLLNLTLFNGLLNSVQSGAEVTYRVSGRMALEGHDDVVLDDLYSPTDSLFPDAFFVVSSVGGSFSRVFTNPFEEPQIKGINLTVDLLPARHAASIENAWSDKSEVRPGETVMVKVVLQPYRGERLVREVPVTIPAQAAKGDMRVLVSDATLLNAITRSLLFGAVNLPGGFAFTPRVTSLDQLISLINRERRSDRLYVTVFQRTPTMLVEDKILPSVPLSQINVLNHKSSSMRPGSTMLFYESILNEASEPVGQVITGSHWLRLTVR